jgi:acetyltransferase-like isoleucine patch superfamily enzyme
MKAIREVGIRRAFRFVWTTLLLVLFRLVIFPQLRTVFLRLCGARIGRDVTLYSFTLINVDRGGFKALQVGDKCVIGHEVMIDLAAPVILEDFVGLAARSIVLTHMNIGYKEHPLQERFPSQTLPTRIRRASFVGAGSIVVAGCTVGPEAFVAAGSLVDRDVGEGEMVAGVPIRTIPTFKPAPGSGLQAPGS